MVVRIVTDYYHIIMTIVVIVPIILQLSDNIYIYDYGYDIVRICVINYWILLIWWILTNMVMDVMLWYVINCVWLWFFQYDNHYHNNYDCDNYYDGCMDSGLLVYG